MPSERLGRLITDLGERSLYEAVSQCSRCGYCEQACPTYVATRQEAQSARGRNQLVRMMLEGKLQDPTAVEQALSSCLLCGACTSVCPAHVPTADIVLEGRRMIRARASRVARFLAYLLAERPRVFRAVLRVGYGFKRLGLSRLAARLGLLRWLGLRGLEEADQHLDEVPRKFLRDILKKDSNIKYFSQATWLYFSACGPNYALPRVGMATIRVLKTSGPGAYLDNPCCGLLFYNYGDLERARALARANIERWEDADRAEAPVIADCSSCVAHLKSYPQLFLEDGAWKERARRFCARVRDVIEILPAASLSAASQCHLEATATYHDACRARNGQGIVSEPRAAMNRMCGDAYRELPEADACCGGAGAFAFTYPELSEELLKRKIAHIAETQARVVAASSTSCLLQLARGLKKYYPECRAVHLSELAAENLDG